MQLTHPTMHELPHQRAAMQRQLIALPVLPLRCAGPRHAASRQLHRARRAMVANVSSLHTESETRPDVTTAAEVPNIIRKEDEQEDPSPFYEPLLRSFLLGLCAGALFETAHVAVKFTSIVGEVGYHKLSEVLPKVVDQFAPLFVGDHVVAVSSWLLFYVIEAVAIVSVLNRYPEGSQDAVHEIANVSTLPRKMLPSAPLENFKKLMNGRRNTAARAAVPVTVAAAAPALDTPLRNEVLVKPVEEVATTSFTATEVQTAQAVAAGASISQVAASAAAPAPPAPTTAPASPAKPRLKSAIVPAPPSLDTRRAQSKAATESMGKTETLEERRKKTGLKPGEWDAGQSLAARRARELMGRRAFLKNFWYAAGISEQIKEKPVGVEILGEKVVLFRDSTGTIRCIGDVCPHRGAPLSGGWVNKVNGHDCVVCPYHGWAFDGEGVLRQVPAAENAGEWPEKQLVDAWPVTERGGFVWLFYGSKDLPEEERPPIPMVPELEDGTWKPVYGSIEFECNHWGVFENAIDMAHIHYLHDDTFGNQGKPQIRDMTCTHDAYGVTAQFRLHNKPVSALWEFSKVPDVKVTAQALLPSTSVITFTLGNGLSFTTFVNTVPINANRTINRFSLVRKLDIGALGSTVFNLDAWDKWARDAMLRILSEDKAMVEQLRPDLLPREISVKADLPQIAFRKLRQEYVEMGYAVSPELATSKFRGDF